MTTTPASWRHQLPVLAAAGYRAVAIDVLGYGRSSRPAEVAAYRIGELVEDSVAVVEALGGAPAVIAGHDWGAVIAANSALVRPDVFRAVALLSIPYAPTGAGPRPTDMYARMTPPGHEFYVTYFQQPGRAEAEIEPDVRGWLLGFYASLSADTMGGPDRPSPLIVPAGHAMRERFAGGLPGWLSEADLDVYAAEFERTGLTGALNRYRNIDVDWADLAAHAATPIAQPSLFIGGALDPSVAGLAAAIDAFPNTLPGLRGSHLLEGAGHWIQQERADEVNALLTGWLAGLP
ncbi:alpha/beta fold hydrolase [Jiangella anatolica]|uniref:Epoxide hydrolase n=1 Tax=Jiangella anatolica TaxID=2670374 RepID=A0A2W2C0C3_9ACTN|nr:alpha/beta fold hydrolase [Jiangella anatolica]PZF85558.1 epoxide hydrolase [Jiangella anatolica]